MSSIRERLERDAEAWRPEPGDILEGTVVEVDQRTSDYGTYPLVIVECEDGSEFAVHAFHTTLKNELAKRRPQPGDRLGVKYVGKQTTTDGGRTYEGYKLVVERATASDADAVDWDRVAVEAEAELATLGTSDERAYAAPDDPVPPPSEKDEPADADVPY